MATLNSYAPPPFTHITPPPGQQISPSAALALVQDYLKQTCTSAHLHPDALFTEVGIAYAGSATTGGIVLHQLRRVEKGLRGVWLGEDLDLENGVAKWSEEIPSDNLAKFGVQDSGLAAQKLGPEELENERNSPSRNYQEQLRDLGEGIVEGEVGDRNNAVRDGGEEPYVQSTMTSKKRRYAEIETETPGVDKEARKRAKAERKKIQKKERHSEREKKKALAEDLNDEDVLVSGTIHVETREEHDDPEPSAHHLPEKISSTITKTPDEVGEIRKQDTTSTDSPQMNNEKELNERDEQEKAPGTSIRQDQTEKDASPAIPKKKRERKTKKKDEESPQMSQTWPGMREEHATSKPAAKTQVNDESNQTGPQDSPEELLVPSSNNSVAKPTTKASINEEIPSSESRSLEKVRKSKKEEKKGKKEKQYSQEESLVPSSSNPEAKLATTALMNGDTQSSDSHSLEMVRKSKGKRKEEKQNSQEESLVPFSSNPAVNSTTKAFTNGDTSPSKSGSLEKKRKSKKQDKRESEEGKGSQEQLLVPSSSNADYLPSTPRNTDAEVVMETPPNMTNGHVAMNGELPVLEQWSESESRHQDEDVDQARRKRNEEKRAKKLKKEVKRKAKEERRAAEAGNSIE